MSAVDEFDTARAAGLSAPRAGRWVAYLRMKAAKGEQPITLEEAVRQVQEADR